MKRIVLITIVCFFLVTSCNNDCKTDGDFKEFYFGMLDTITSYGNQFDTNGEVVFIPEICRTFSDYADYLKALTQHEFRYTIIEQPIYESQSDLKADIQDLTKWYQDNKCRITKEKADSIANTIHKRYSEVDEIPPIRLSPEDFIIAELDLYEVKSNLHPILDSIIESVSKCHRYAEIKLEFVFHVYEEDGTKRIWIGNTDPDKPAYSFCSGVFYYKDYFFSYTGEFLNTFFEKTTQIEQHKCITPEKLKFLSGPDDRWSAWDFIYEDENLKCISLVNCDYFWIDEEYAPIPED